MRDPSRSEVRRPRWVAALESCAHLFEVADDQVVAARSGLSVPIVRAYRVHRGHWAAGPPEPSPGAPLDPASALVLDDNAHRVGRDADWLVARELGVTVAAIEAWRSARHGAFHGL